MDFFGQLFEILKFVYEPIYQGFKYYRSLDENIETLNGKMEELGARKNDLKRKLHIAESKYRKKPKTEVRVWFKNVEKITTEVRAIKDQVQQGRFPNYWLQIKLSMLVEGKIREVVELQEKSPFADTLFADPLPSIGMFIPETPLVGRTTAEKSLETIWECLMDADIGTIGIYGMGGIGKTSIMKIINNRLLQRRDLFNKIIWVTVSKDSNLQKIQNDIATILALDLSNVEDEIIRAAKLLKKLAFKKFVLILDDMWDAFSLEKIGVPTPNKRNCCKLVLTTRSLDVCRGMKSQRKIEVESLSREEAWELFKLQVGNHVDFTLEVEKIAKLVAQECACLPLAIITVGGAMREVDDIREWRNALVQLRNSTKEIKGMNDEVFGRLKFSYKRLENNRLRECFLYCAFYPKYSWISIKELIEYWIAEGLIEDLKNREAQIDEGYVIFKKLKDACMLQSVGSGDKFVKMHDLINDMAINIINESHRSIVKAGVSLKEFPKEEKWMEDVGRLYLTENDIQVLSGQPRCPKLLTLLLKRNPLMKIQHSFFQQMHNLRVLDLSYTKIEYLPESLSALENLRALLLHSCDQLKKVPSLAKLKELRLLDLYETNIEELPQGMDEAYNLKRINLTYTGNLQTFSSGVLPKLFLLEDLLMFRSRWKWPSKSTMTNGGAGVEDIISLTRLSNLEIRFEDVQGLINYVRSEKWKLLKSFDFAVGSLQAITYSTWNKKVNIEGCNIVCQESSLVFPDDTQYLHMDNCVTRLSEFSNLKDIKHLDIRNCDSIEDCIYTEGQNTLSSLEKLQLEDLRSLRTIWKGVAACNHCTSLKELIINRCHNMHKLLPLGMFKHLPNLEVIHVENCKLMEEIVEGEANEEEKITFPNLMKLSLSNLPELKRICSREIICESLHNITVWACPHLKKLPFSSNNLARSLKQINGEKEWLDGLSGWDDLNVKTLLQCHFVDDDDEANARNKE